MPTFFGPTNIPPLEAFATECPVAISNAYAMPEQVGDAGLFFDPNSTEQIADAIYKLWTDDNLVEILKQKGIAKNKQWGQKQFSERLEYIIQDVIPI
jgi:glycosyltransferase involved in cell wall biosynthesis